LDFAEGHGNVLLPNAQEAAHPDDNRNSLTIAVQQHVVHIANALVVRAHNRRAN